jgi:perosamine synthetase
VYYGKRAGSIGRFGAFSFHGTKTITTGEGGIFVTNDPDLYEQVLTLSNHGRARGQSKQFWPDMVGFKYKMSNIQAAIGCAQLKRVTELVKIKEATFNNYYTQLRGLPISMNPNPSGCANGYWMPTVVASPSLKFNRDLLIYNFKQNGIDARVVFWPLSTIIKSVTRSSNKMLLSSTIHLRSINLPSPFCISKPEIDRVSNVLKEHFVQLARS